MTLLTRMGWLASVVAVVMVGCADYERRKAEFVHVDLKPVGHNAGKIGYVTLVPRDKVTDMSFYVSGVYRTSREVRLYTYIYKGTCANRAAQPAYSLNDIVMVNRTTTGWAFNRTAPAPLSTLSGQGYSVVLTTGPEEGNTEQFCGEIP
ncbi:hypothetical protein ACIQUS_22465 [Pseudomonas sp. NPDC090755]|uniref:hypothetical protein n=1 Tax=Pseudomonas sp. NPDC090755 TaxID=3364481 RepID=UPI00383B432C